MTKDAEKKDTKHTKEEESTSMGVESGNDDAQKTEKESLLAECEKYKSIAQRAQADLVNFRRRVAEDADRNRKRNIVDSTKPFLDVADEMERALFVGDKLENSNPNDKWLLGVEAVYKKLVYVLKSHGFERYQSINEPFDPMLHEALATTDTDSFPPNTVIEEIKAGYKYQGEVVRPAQVRITNEKTQNK